MKRREFILLAAGAMTWPLPAYPQPTIPVVGFLGSEVEERNSSRFAAFHKALGEAGSRKATTSASNIAGHRGRWIAIRRLCRIWSAVVFR
jgi:hypothetical protein